MDLKTTVSTAILRGHCPLSEFSAEEIRQTLPFIGELFDFDAVQEVNGVPILMRNSNWFWSVSNHKCLTALVNDIDAVNSFETEDTGYGWILGRYGIGDGYGIMKTIPRATREAPRKEVFEKLCKHYNLGCTGRKEFRSKEYYYKLLFCMDNDVPFREFALWVFAEKILETRLNFVEAQNFDSLFFGDIDELKFIYGSSEYTQILVKMRTVLDSFREDKENIANSYIEEAKLARDKGDYGTWYKIKDKIEALYEPPDGAFDYEASKCAEALDVALKKLQEVAGLGDK